MYDLDCIFIVQQVSELVWHFLQCITLNVNTIAQLSCSPVYFVAMHHCVCFDRRHGMQNHGNPVGEDIAS